MANDIYYFRVHNDGTQLNTTENGWQKSPGLDTKAIAAIKDSLDKMPASGKVGTSIPTPLARIYLFKTAFELVSSTDSTKVGVYDELVSDCLDLIQLLFEKGADLSKFEFVTWDPSEEVRTLRRRNDEFAKVNPNYNAMNLLADSLELAVDAAPDFARGVTLIKYEGMLIGGTSPYSLLFTSANLRYELEARRSSSQGYDFSSNKKVEFCGSRKLRLSARPKDFQTFLKSFVNDSRHLLMFAQGGPLKTFADYVNSETTGVDIISGSSYESSFPEITGLNVLGIPFRYNEMATVPHDSDFMMRPSVEIYKSYMSYPPLVLPSEFAATGWTYVDDDWDTKTQLTDWAVRSAGKIGTRKLPKNGSTNGEMTTQKYPWVSNEDFLCDNLIDVSFELNTKYFFNNADVHPRFLLPIRKEYFMFFTLEDLRRDLKMTVDCKETKNADGDVIDVRINSVKVELTIPLQSSRNSIKLTREYGSNETSKYIIKKAKPGLGLGVFPFYRIDEEDMAQHNIPLKNEYSIYLYDSGMSAAAVQLKFYNKKYSLENPVIADEVVRTRLDSGTSKVYNLRSTTSSNMFDLIEVRIADGHDGFDTALVIPEWSVETSTGRKRDLRYEDFGSESSRTIFSIDFGTSNTHVAYWNPNERAVKPFEVPIDEQQMVLLNKPYEKRNVVDFREPSAFGRAIPRFTEYLREFMPSVIGSGHEVSYPVKTATLEGVGFTEGKDLFGNINIGYDIENERVDLSKISSFQYFTNLKWACQKDRNDGRAKQRVEAFCEQTLWMLKNLLVLKGFYPKDIQIIYFYPESMMPDDKDMFKKAWDATADRVLTKCGFSIVDKECKSELESIAPYYSLLKRDESIFAYNSVNIDIGGGTTDILIFDRLFYDPGTQRRYAAYEASVFFAGNDIWDKTFPSGSKNGFVEFMKDLVPSSVISPESMKAYETFSRKDDPAEMTTFFFKHSDFDYGGKIATYPKLRYVLFLHYASIIYYLCDMIKQVRKEQNPDFKLPNSITFTGKGSEYLKIITPDPEQISRITFSLFLAFGFNAEEFENGFHVTYPENPKGLTAEGGVLKFISDPAIRVDFVKKDPNADAFAFMKKDKIEGRERTEYENVGRYILGFDYVPGTVYTVSSIKSYKEAVMKHFSDMIEAIFSSPYIKSTLSPLSMNLENDDKKVTLEFASRSFDMHANRYIAEHGVGAAPLDGTIFFLALKNTLIDLSLYYFKKLHSNGMN